MGKMWMDAVMVKFEVLPLIRLEGLGKNAKISR
jgi:hypothetical protein